MPQCPAQHPTPSLRSENTGYRIYLCCDGCPPRDLIPRLAAQGAREPCLVLSGGFPRAQPMTQQIARCPGTGGHPTMTRPPRDISLHPEGDQQAGATLGWYEGLRRAPQACSPTPAGESCRRLARLSPRAMSLPEIHGPSREADAQAVWLQAAGLCRTGKMSVRSPQGLAVGSASAQEWGSQHRAPCCLLYSHKQRRVALRTEARLP